LLRIIQKGRQTGISYADAYHSVKVASNARARFDVFVSTRDRFQARLYIEDCKNWAEVLEIVLLDLGEVLFDKEANASAYVLQFSNGKRIYALSSNPNALAGKRGHVKLDEFALHEDQRLLYRIANDAIRGHFWLREAHASDRFEKIDLPRTYRDILTPDDAQPPWDFPQSAGAPVRHLRALPRPAGSR